jgi:2-deoxy-D-gluconate 3-dehydrogenase
MTLPKTPSFRLDGKRALVTGGSRGIGLGCAVALAEVGAEVVIAARNKTEIGQAVAQMQDAGMNADGHPLDVTDVSAIRAFFAAHGPFDVLVNSAGLARHTPSIETDPDDFDAVTAINFKGAYFLAQEAARGMANGGSIIQISSQMAHVGGIERAVYCGTKHGVEGFTKAMAIEWGKQRIRVNTICPTFVLTALTQPTFDDPEKRAWVEGNIKLGRMAEVEDLMGAVVFLASDASAMVTGTSLLVDGGWTAD